MKGDKLNNEIPVVTMSELAKDIYYSSTQQEQAEIKELLKCACN